MKTAWLLLAILPLQVACALWIEAQMEEAHKSARPSAPAPTSDES